MGDDSGLVVPALDGRPGIFSARYAGNHDFDKTFTKVLEEMQDKEIESLFHYGFMPIQRKWSRIF